MKIENIKPSDIIIKGACPLSGAIGKSEYEMVVANIVCICKKLGNKWALLNEEIYKTNCDHDVSDKELGYFWGLYEKGYLDLIKGEHKLRVNNELLGLLKEKGYVRR